MESGISDQVWNISELISTRMTPLPEYITSSLKAEIVYTSYTKHYPRRARVRGVVVSTPGLFRDRKMDDSR
jgi:hypothetical protein